MNRNFIRRHITSVAIVLFIALFITLQTVRPAFLYGHDGSLRPFGVGYAKSTVIPMWAATVVLAIMSYYAVLYYLAMPRMRI